MKKVVCFGLCFLIVLCSFVISFATINLSDDIVYSLVPKESDIPSPIRADTYDFYTNSDSTTYIVFTKPTNDVNYFVFSESPNVIIKLYQNGVEFTSHNLSSEYNGYYYYSNLQAYSDVSVPVVNGSYTPQQLIDYIFSTSPTLVIGSLVDGSVSWVTSMVQAVKNSGLLLFFVLVCFIGLGIGLFRRFTNG